MANHALADVVQYIRGLSGDEQTTALSDGQLLQQFITRRDDRAFAAILHRHGLLVFTVCLQVLRDPHEAEDAFQATVLVLASKAASIRQPESLAAWLHRVALNMAQTLKTAAAQRQVREKTAAVLMAQAGPVAEATFSDRQDLIHEEVDRLPAKYRIPIVLCYFKEKTHEEAAQQLDWPIGTVKGRLARARDLLQQRLVRRGVTLSAGGLTAALTESLASAHLPAPLVGETLRAALAFATTGTMSTGAVTARSLALAQGALQTMTPIKLGYLPILFFAIGLVGMMSAVLALAPPSPPPANVTLVAEKEENIPAILPRKIDGQGDPLPPGALVRIGSLRFRHADLVTSLGFAPDGKTLAARGGDGTIRLWEVPVGRELGRLAGHQPDAWCVAYAPDGKTLASGSGDDLIRLWDAQTNKELHRIKSSQKGVRSLAYASTSKMLATGGENGSVRLWDLTTLQEIRQLIGAVPSQWGASAVVFSPDDQQLAATIGYDIYRWDVKSGKLLRHERTSVFQQDGCIAFSPDGKILATKSITTSDDVGSHLVHLRQVATNNELRRLRIGVGNVGCAVAFSPDRNVLATAGDQIRLWEIATGKELRVFADSDLTASLTFSPDGKILAAGKADNTIRLWDVSSGKPLSRPAGHQGGIRSIALSPDGTKLATAGGDTIRFWQVATGMELQLFKAHHAKHFGFYGARCLAFAPDGKSLASGGGDKTVRLWDPQKAQEIRSFQGPQAQGAYDGGLAYSPDGRIVAAAGQDDAFDGPKVIRLWDVATGKPLRTILTGAQVQPLQYDGSQCFAFSPDSKLLAAGSTDFSAGAGVRIWEVASGKELRSLPGPKGWVSAVAFSPDGRTLATASGADLTLRVWEVATGKERRRVALEKVEMARLDPFGRRASNWRAGLLAIAYSPDGRTLAVGRNNGHIYLWALASAKPQTLSGHQDGVNALTFSRDGNILVSGSADSTALTWDMRALTRSAELHKPAKLTATELEAHWATLGSSDAASAYQAFWELAAHPQETLAFFQERLRPIPTGTSDKRVLRWIADLESPQFPVRKSALAELEKLGDAAECDLRRVLTGKPSLELRRRVESLLEKWDGTDFSQDRLRSMRAVELLELLATAPARQQLQKLSSGAMESRLTQEAQTSLDRLNRRTPLP